VIESLPLPVIYALREKKKSFKNTIKRNVFSVRYDLMVKKQLTVKHVIQCSARSWRNSERRD